MSFSKPLFEEIPYLAPSLRFEQIQATNAVWLDSSDTSSKLSQYSYIGFEPVEVLKLKDGILNGQHLPKAPDEIIREILKGNPLTVIDELPPFQGGLAGFFSYDFGRYFEDLPNIAEDDIEFEDFYLGVFDLVLAFDHRLQKSWLISSSDYRLSSIAKAEYAAQRLQYGLELVHQSTANLQHHSRMGRQPSSFAQAVESTHHKQSYQQMVQKTIDYIYDGDIFEVNVTQRFKTSFIGCPKQLYYQLRDINPAPFSAFCNFEDSQLLSSSPERFVKLENGQVETRPIKGTRRRSSNQKLDKELGLELKSSEKDRAENIMIVDLMRNDLSKVCKPHSIQVPVLCGLESYATVHHLVSTVLGKLKETEDAASLLRAVFPGGSITGAPKIRAMEIIEQLEPMRRGPYCGAIGYMAFNGAMDLNIIIRTMCIKDGMLTFGAGGAITADSSPHEEYEESLSKAKALRSLCDNGLI